jgi:hypothetical protein
VDLQTTGGRIEQVGWTYPDPRNAFAQLHDHYCFYPSKLECFQSEQPTSSPHGPFTHFVRCAFSYLRLCAARFEPTVLRLPSAKTKKRPKKAFVDLVAG